MKEKLVHLTCICKSRFVVSYCCDAVDMSICWFGLRLSWLWLFFLIAFIYVDSNCCLFFLPCLGSISNRSLHTIYVHELFFFSSFAYIFKMTVSISIRSMWCNQLFAPDFLFLFAEEYHSILPSPSNKHYISAHIIRFIWFLYFCNSSHSLQLFSIFL